MKPSIWNCYLVSRFLIGTVDMVTDVTHSARLFYNSHPVWGSLTILFPLLAIFAAVSAVVGGRIRKGDPMSSKKFLLLVIVSLASIFEAFFESGPQLVLQLTIIWRGVLLDDMLIVFQEEHLGTSRWVFGVLSFLALISSFVSLVVTTMYYNNEKLKPARPAKFFLALGLTILAILYRVFVTSVLFAVTPFWILGIGFLVYLINVIVNKATGHSWECLLYSFTSLLCPGGYTKNQGQSSTAVFRAGNVLSTPRANISEVERARINQESLLKRVYVSQGLFSLFNVMLLIAFVALVETELLFNPDIQDKFVPIITDRLFLYIVPCGLLLVLTLFTLLYIREIRLYRDFTRTWDAITPKNLRSSRESRNGTLASEAGSRIGANFRPSAPGIYEQQLPLNPTAYIEVIHEEEQPHSRPRSPICANFPKPGNNKCDNESCVTCEFLIEGTMFRSTMTGKDYRFVTSVSCNAKSVIYLVTCSKCRKQYVGKTEQELRQRHYGHRREIETESSPLGKHFAQGCGYTNWRFQVIDQGPSNELQRREGYWQHELMTLLPWGLNIRDELNGGIDIQVK